MIDPKKAVEIDEDVLFEESMRLLREGVGVSDDEIVERMHPDPVERIEYLYGPKERPYAFTKPLGFADTWDEDRLAIATNPEYIDRCRESYAFADLLGREYNGVVFG